MPSEDFKSMSDQELSDIVSYVRSLPAVNNTVPAPTFGPLGKILLATGQMKFVRRHHPHHRPAPRQPAHGDGDRRLRQTPRLVCLGCHGHDLSGGPIAGGDPSLAAGAQPHAGPDGPKGWTYEQFVTALREGPAADGTAIRDPMTVVAPFGQNMTETERQALWAYLQSLPPVSKRIEEK